MDDQGFKFEIPKESYFDYILYSQRTACWSRKIRMIKLSNLNIKGVLLSLYFFNHKEPQNPRSSSSFLSQFWQSLGTDILVFTTGTGHTNVIFFFVLAIFLVFQCWVWYSSSWEICTQTVMSSLENQIIAHVMIFMLFMFLFLEQ